MDFRTVRRLTYFVALAEELHFGRAAERLGMSQPPLSQQIQVLESELKVPLLLRSRRRVALTGPGRVLYAEAKRVLAEVERLAILAQSAKDSSIGVLQIGCFTSAMFAPMPEIVRTLQAQNPRLEIVLRELRSGESIELVRRGDIDAALVRAMHPGADFLHTPVILDVLTLAVPTSHRLAAADEVGLEEIKHEKVVQFARSASPEFYDRIISACANFGVTLNVTSQGSTVMSQLGFVSCGMGVALVPSSFCNLQLGNVTFVRLKQRVSCDASMIFRNNDGGQAIQALMQPHLGAQGMDPAMARPGPASRAAGAAVPVAPATPSGSPRPPRARRSRRPRP